MSNSEQYDDNERYRPAGGTQPNDDATSHSPYGTGRFGTMGGEGTGRPIPEYAANRDSVEPLTGHGQNNYADDDERLREIICDRLMETNRHIDCTQIKVDVRDGMVTLGGTTYSDEVKQLAEDTARRVAGVQGVSNKLKLS